MFFKIKKSKKDLDKKIILLDTLNAKSGGALVIVDQVINQFIKHNQGDTKLFVTQLKSSQKRQVYNRDVIRIYVDDKYYNLFYMVYWHFFKLPYILLKNDISHLVALSGFVFFRYFKRNIKITVTINNVLPFISKKEKLNYFPSVISRVKFSLLKKIYCHSIKKSDRIILPSHYLSNLIQKACKCKSKNIQVQLTGCNDSIPLIQNKLNYKNTISLLYLSPIWKYKNHIILIRALCYLKQNNSYNFKLYLVGGFLQKNIRKELEQSARNYNVTDNIVFLGNVDDKVKNEQLKKADILLFASKYEANSIILSEYLACGKLIVSSDSASNKEILSNSALYFNNNDHVCAASQIIRLIEDEKLCEELLKNSKIRVSQLKWDGYALNLLDMSKSKR
jgi:glycosyltransferase involved in cell wall biosynthesis